MHFDSLVNMCSIQLGQIIRIRKSRIFSSLLLINIFLLCSACTRHAKSDEVLSILTDWTSFHYLPFLEIKAIECLICASCTFVIVYCAPKSRRSPKIKKYAVWIAICRPEIQAYYSNQLIRMERKVFLEQTIQFDKKWDKSRCFLSPWSSYYQVWIAFFVNDTPSLSYF